MSPALKPPESTEPFRHPRPPFNPLAVSCRTGRGWTTAAFERCLAAIRLVLLTLLLTEPLTAQTIANGGTRITAAGGREVIVLSAQAASQAAAQTDAAGFAAQSHETATQRIHVVTFEGETFTAATPLDGPWSRIVFDPARLSFVSLLPSIRVELRDGVQIEAVAAEVGATGITVFESLGFAFLDLPEELHPADAVARVSNVLGQPGASVRLRGPRIEWR